VCVCVTVCVRACVSVGTSPQWRGRDGCRWGGTLIRLDLGVDLAKGGGHSRQASESPGGFTT
jgi:hypothetical protein